MFADMAGYTALSQRDEALALELLSQYGAIVRPLFVQFHGIEIKTIGDAFLAEFPSALSATQCAVEIQRSLHTYNAAAPEERQILVRIGLHVGDIVHRGGDVFGDSVNIASRIQPTADPGGISVSEDVARQIRNKIDIPLAELQPRTLKNIEYPLRIFGLQLPWLSSLRESRSGESQSTSHVPSVAVLPFVNMSSDAGNEYFSDGLAEEIINALSKLEGLHVTARTSAFQFRGKELDIRDIGRQLNVTSVLEGSVRKMGNQLRVMAQLISVADGFHLWSERFDRNIRDVFAVQDEIAMAVVENLKVKLLEGERERVTKRYTQDEEAYQLYLKGRYYWNKRYPRAMLKAVEFFEKAVEKDPRYALSYVGIADVFNMLAEFGFVPPQEACSKAMALLQKAREIDDSLGELYVSLGLITYCYEWDLPAAERHLRHSIELNPQNWYAHGTLGEILTTRGLPDEAFEEVKRAMELDPLSSMSRALRGIMLVGSGRVDEGRNELLKTIAMDPDQPMFYYWAGMFFLSDPVMTERAIEYLQKAVDLGVSPAYGYLGVAYALDGRKEDALKCLEKLEKIERERFIPFPVNLLFYLKPGLRHFRSFKRKYVPPYLKGIIYCALKMEEKALAQFEKSIQARDYLLPAFFRIAEKYPWMSELMNAPRLQALRTKIKTA
jgi:TolB-like protein/Tfp pilus assembly protein PilF